MLEELFWNRAFEFQNIGGNKRGSFESLALERRASGINVSVFQFRIKYVVLESWFWNQVSTLPTPTSPYLPLQYFLGFLANFLQMLRSKS